MSNTIVLYLKCAMKTEEIEKMEKDLSKKVS